ncbi:MAG: DUF2807 domain-containing protein, partial [Paramuribaculum sp.]|nr:DUF2807 domain-containing protein [Paramuribaculum sp.]
SEAVRTLSGRTSTLTFSPGNNYSAIDISTAINVNYSVAPECAVSVTLPEEYASKLVVKVEKGTLKMTINGGVNLGNADKITATVSGPMPNDIEVSSAAGFYLSRGDVPTDRSVNIEAASAAKVEIETLVCGNIEIDSSSASVVNINSLKCANLDIETSSASKASIDNVSANRVVIDSSSASNVYVAGKSDVVNIESSSASHVNASSLKSNDGKAEASSGASIKCNVTNLTKKASSGGSVTNS